MEYVYGYDLQQMLESSNHIGYSVLINTIIQIASGLEKAHHYDIFHNDLHTRNIRINTLEYVKIIDFLWRDFHKDKVSDQSKDINDFKSIVDELSKKCNDEDSYRISVVNEYCKRISSFTNLRYNIERIDKISFDLSLIPQRSLNILYKLLLESNRLTNRELLTGLEHISEIIPEIFIPVLTEYDEKLLNKNREYDDLSRRAEVSDELPPYLVGKVKYKDERVSRIEMNLQYQLIFLLLPLKNSGFINYDYKIINKGEAFVGPYYLDCQIWFTSKFIELRGINKSVIFSKVIDESFFNLILTPVDELLEYLP